MGTSIASNEYKLSESGSRIDSTILQAKAEKVLMEKSQKNKVRRHPYP